MAAPGIGRGSLFTRFYEGSNEAGSAQRASTEHVSFEASQREFKLLILDEPLDGARLLQRIQQIMERFENHLRHNAVDLIQFISGDGGAWLVAEQLAGRRMLSDALKIYRLVNRTLVHPDVDRDVHENLRSKIEGLAFPSLCRMLQHAGDQELREVYMEAVRVIEIHTDEVARLVLHKKLMGVVAQILKKERYTAATALWFSQRISECIYPIVDEEKFKGECSRNILKLEEALKPSRRALVFGDRVFQLSRVTPPEAVVSSMAGQPVAVVPLPAEPVVVRNVVSLPERKKWTKAGWARRLECFSFKGFYNRFEELHKFPWCSWHKESWGRHLMELARDVPMTEGAHTELYENMVLALGCDESDGDENYRQMESIVKKDPVGFYETLGKFTAFLAVAAMHENSLDFIQHSDYPASMNPIKCLLDPLKKAFDNTTFWLFASTATIADLEKKARIRKLHEYVEVNLAKAIVAYLERMSSEDWDLPPCEWFDSMVLSRTAEDKNHTPESIQRQLMTDCNIEIARGLAMTDCKIEDFKVLKSLVDNAYNIAGNDKKRVIIEVLRRVPIECLREHEAHLDRRETIARLCFLAQRVYWGVRRIEY